MRDTQSDSIVLAPPAVAGASPCGRKGVIEGFGGEVKRTMDAAAFNAIANHPEVRPWLGGEGEIDLTDTIANPANYALAIDGGGFLLIARDAGVYEVHSLFLPDARRHSLAAMASGIYFMFTRTDAFRLVTQVPDANKAAAALATKGGFREWFCRDDTPLGPSAWMMLELDGWIQSEDHFEQVGEWFHGELRNAKHDAGSVLPEHPEDYAHDHAVGAAVEIIRAGQVDKGVASYNRWAVCAGYAPVALISRAPAVIDVLDAVVMLAPDGGMEVLSCR